MIKELTIKYKGIDLMVRGTYIRGRGYINFHDEPEVDEFMIEGYDSFDDMTDITVDEWELEQLCIDKLKQ